VRYAFDQKVDGHPDASPRLFRWILKFLAHRKDSCAALRLAAQPDVMNVDPQVAADYQAAIGTADRRVVERLMLQLDAPAEDRTDALDLHLLRALSLRDTGTVEGEIFRRIAEDDTRRAPVGSWAWQAYARSAAWRQDEAIASAVDEHDASVRRGVAISFRSKRDRSRSFTRFLRHMDAAFPALRYTTAWVEAA
jgi:hypothetical protein